MKILWLNPSFLDYRVPVYAELDRLTGGNFHVIYSTIRTPPRVDARIRQAIGPRAIGLTGEKSFGMTKEDAHFANTGIRIPYQPGLLKRALEIKADVIVAEGFFQWTPAAIFKRLSQKSRLVISYERTAHTERNCPAWRTLYRRAVVRTTDAMTCNGQLSKQYAADTLGMPPARITTGHMVADVVRFSESAATTSPADRQRQRDAMGAAGLCFLYVGGITERKGTAELIDAWAKFQATSPSSATLVLAGDGVERPRLEALIEKNRIPNVRFIGAVSYDQLPAVYTAADVFVMPTLEDNWSLVVPEAMACNLPVLCSIHNGCWPELVLDGQNGWTFDPLRPDDLATLFSRCMEKQRELPAMGEISRQIISRHTPTTAAQAVLQACEIALATR